MAFEKTYCANQECRKHTEYHGGRFIYSAEKKTWYCDECYRSPAVMNPGKDLWNFETTHFNGQRVEVKGLRHLRDLEQQFGVSNHAANYDQRNWDTPPPARSVDRSLPPQLAEMLKG